MRVVLAANPGGVGHQWIAKRYVFKSAAWVPFREETSGRQFVSCPSLYLDNDFIDRDGFRQQLESATATDPELGRACLEGDWTVARGAYFGSVLEEWRNAIDPWPVDGWSRDGWWFYLAHDFGVSAPSVTHVCGRSPGTEGAARRPSGPLRGDGPRAAPG